MNPMIAGGTKYDQSLIGTDSIRKPIFKTFGSNREVKLLQLFLDHIFQEKFDQHLARRPGGELDVKGRLVPYEATPIFEPEMEGQRSSVEQDHVKSEPAMGKQLPDQVPVKGLLCRIEELARRVRSRPPGLMLFKEPLQIPENFRLASALMKAKFS
jgi:hypothetical protein